MTEEDIFHEALGRRPEDRAAYLRQACPDNPAQRAAIEALLQADLGASGFLESPPGWAALGGAVDRPIAEGPGTVIGPYKLLEQIGEGGFGVVFMAEQTQPVRRKVALKVLKPGMDTRQVVARFEAERQALALMDHPNIAQVFDGGTTETGRPYFVMELVRGVPITEFCDQSCLAIRQRLELFVDVCQAVQHAHQKGVIHRDIKPTNVMVTLHDGQPVAKVIDFGIAKAMGQQLTEKTLFTNFAQMIGTPLYMSPEQAEMSGLDVDTRSDIYSLGVLLYELLTGTTPFENERLSKAGYDEMRRIIREEEPPKPSTRISTIGKLATTASQKRQADPRKLSKLYRGELDWIVMKSLEKDCNRRYETATGFALDVKRYLNDEPVVACPPSARYRLRKFAWRNKRVLAAAMLLTTTLILGAAISTWQAIRATEAKGVASAKEADAVTQAAKAKVVADLLQEMLGSANPDSAKGAEYTVRQLLDEFSEKLGDQLKEQPEAEAAIRATIGNAYQRLGLVDSAEPHLRTALALRRRLCAADDLSVAQSLRDLAMNAFEAGNLAEAEKLGREALAIHQKLNVANGETIDTLNTLLLILRDGSRLEEAAQFGEQALAIARQQPGRYPEVATVLHRLAAAVEKQGDLAKAEQLAREAVTLHRQLHAENHPETAWGLSELASILKRQRRFDEAEKYYRESIAIFQRHVGPNHKWLAVSYMELAEVLKLQDRSPEMIDRELAALSLQSVRQIAGDPDACLQRAVDHVKLGEWERMGDCFEQFANAGRESTVETKYRLADACSGLGRLLCERGRTDQAEKVFRFALSVREPVDGAPGPARLAQHLDYENLGQIHARKGRWKEAAASLARAVELDPKDHWSAYQLGFVLAELGNLPAYQEYCNGMLSRWGKVVDPHLAERTVNACLMLPGGIPDPAQLTSLVQTALLVDEKEELRLWVLFTAGLHDYRCGRFAEARTACRNSRQRAPSNYIAALRVMNQTVEAMLYRLRPTRGGRRWRRLAGCFT